MFTLPLRATVCAVLALLSISVAACSPGGEASADTQWTTYTDPGAHAFTVEAPVGWQVAGGTQVLSPVDTREGVVMRSPDGAILLFFGDPSLPIFAIPTPMLAARGFHEGMTYSPGPGFNLAIAAYVPGQRFAAAWGGFRTSRVCGQVALRSSRLLPEVAEAINGLYSSLGVPGSAEAGDAAFACVLPSGAAGSGYALTATRLSPATSLGLWNVATATGFIAPADRTAEARALLAHVIESYRLDPAWAAKQPSLPANADQMVVQSNAAIAQSIRSPAPDGAMTMADAAPASPAAAPTETPPPETPAPQYEPTGAPPQNTYAPGPPPQVAYAPSPPPSFGGEGGGPPMNMNWAFQSQAANAAAGDAAVRNAFNSAYALLSDARANGHPVEGTLVLGNQPNTFGDGGYADRSNRTTRAIEDHTLRATQGCNRLMEDSRGNRWYSC